MVQPLLASVVDALLIEGGCIRETDVVSQANYVRL